MAINPMDSAELQKALGDAAGKASALWTAFITFLLYLAIAFGSVTQRDLFLETPIKLPVLNVDLPFLGFFIVAPSLLVIFHFFLFLQLQGLAVRARAYNRVLTAEAPVASDRESLRQRLDSFFVLQMLAGPREQQTGFPGLSIRIISWITLVGAPLLVLLQCQVTFLPYHQGWATWLQRANILIDLLIVWYFWLGLRILEIRTRWTSKAWTFLGLISSLAVLCFSTALATFPGEWMNEHLRDLRFFAMQSPWPSKNLASLQELLFVGFVDEVSGRPSSIFSNRLVLTDQVFVDIDRLDKVEFSRSFRGRDLRRAVLNKTDLRKADFTGALLNEASFVDSKLQGARFDCASRKQSDQEESDDSIERWPDDGCASLIGATLKRAQLQGADLDGARLNGASFEEAKLEGASLVEAHIQEANFSGAQAKRTLFDGALLRGAIFTDARLQGASFEQAELQGASFTRAKLQGASFLSANAQAASFDWSDLHCVSFERTQLQGAWLSSAHLQGAYLEEANMIAANLGSASVWRARGDPDVSLSVAFQIDSSSEPWKQPGYPQSSFQAWRDALLNDIPSGMRHDALVECISVLGATVRKPSNLISPKLWTNLMTEYKTGRTQNGHERVPEFVTTLGDLACADDAPPYVARGLIERASGSGAYSSIFGDRLRKGKTDLPACPGVRGFSNEDWARLNNFAPHLDSTTASKGGGQP